METYRLFIAAELPEQIKDALTSTQEQLRAARHPVKWVAREAMHLTLKFLGELDVAALPEIIVALRDALREQETIPLHLAAPGAFPNARRPSVVWVGVGGATERLALAHSRLDAAMAAFGVARETRPFRAHLTLGRLRGDATPEQHERLGAAVRGLAPPEPLSWVVDQIILFRSELRPGGSVYTHLADVAL